MRILRAEPNASCKFDCLAIAAIPGNLQAATAEYGRIRDAYAVVPQGLHPREHPHGRDQGGE